MLAKPLHNELPFQGYLFLPVFRQSNAKDVADVGSLIAINPQTNRATSLFCYKASRDNWSPFSISINNSQLLTFRDMTTARSTAYFQISSLAVSLVSKNSSCPFPRHIYLDHR